MTVVLWERRGREVVERLGAPVQSHPKASRGPQTTTAAPILMAPNKKGSLCSSSVWATQPASGKSAPVPPECSPQSSPRFLSLTGAVCSARQNNSRQGPNSRPKPPWTNCFHLRPIFFEDATSNSAGMKMSANNEVRSNKKREAQKTGADHSFDHLPGTLGPLFCLNAWTALTHLMSYVLFSHRTATRTCETLPFFFHRKATAAQPASVSRHIPFPGDSGGGERLKCTTLLVNFFMPGLKAAQRFLSKPKWVQNNGMEVFPSRGQWC